jgi:hypothetical protein
MPNCDVRQQQKEIMDKSFVDYDSVS